VIYPSLILYGVGDGGANIEGVGYRVQGIEDGGWRIEDRGLRIED
jgi:hypothetical protein